MRDAVATANNPLDYKPSCVVAVRDNRGATIDRYTILLQGPLGRVSHVVASAEQAKDRGIFEHIEGTPEPSDDVDVEWTNLPELLRQGVMRAIGELFERRA